MSKIIEPLRGVHDVLPAQAPAWQHLERTAREVFAAYGYEEFRVPIIEQTQLFKRSIGPDGRSVLMDLPEDDANE